MPSRALLLPCSRTLSPAPLPSCRRAVAPQAVPKLRLQGFAPHVSPSLELRRFRPQPGTELSWASRPPGCSPPSAFRGSHHRSPHGLAPSGADDLGNHPSGYCHRWSWLVSLETADPPGLCRLARLTNVWSSHGCGSHLLGPRGASPSPANPLCILLLVRPEGRS